MRRREGWEGGVSKGIYKRMSYKGRKMHRGYCREEGHKINVSPTKPSNYVPPKSTKKRGRSKKLQVEAEIAEIQMEAQMQNEQSATCESMMMDDLMNKLKEEEVFTDSVMILRCLHFNQCNQKGV